MTISMFAEDLDSQIETFEPHVSDRIVSYDTIPIYSSNVFGDVLATDKLWTQWGTGEPSDDNRCVALDEDTQAWVVITCNAYNLFLCEVHSIGACRNYF